MKNYDIFFFLMCIIFNIFKYLYIMFIYFFNKNITSVNDIIFPLIANVVGSRATHLTYGNL